MGLGGIVREFSAGYAVTAKIRLFRGGRQRLSSICERLARLTQYGEGTHRRCSGGSLRCWVLAEEPLLRLSPFTGVSSSGKPPGRLALGESEAIHLTCGSSWMSRRMRG